VQVPAQHAGGTVFYDTSVAHIARVYDYWLGGKDNFAADREAAEQAIQINPDIVHIARANRAFLARAVSYLAGEAGIRQFLDIGTGIPTASNTHEVAQAIAPESRVVYVDHDPIVLSHARALLTSSPQGATAYVDADLRDPAQILREARQTLDFTRPVAIMLVAILHLIGESDDPQHVVRQLVAAVPPGSYLVISHPASDLDAGAMVRMASRLNQLTAQKGTPRTGPEVASFLDTLQLVDPGLVRVPEWHPASPQEAATPCAMWAAIARKP
jgi:SAM-dependent methyltransferase